jgi:3-oxo-5-alpha-steroid 4-dehydrogenase 1
MKTETLEYILLIWIALALIVHITMFYVTAPFGRHTSDKWGLTLNNKVGWFIMELPSLLIMSYFLFFGTYSMDSYVWILFALWIFHYTNRTIIYPLRIKPTDKKMPVSIALSAIIFNIVNAGINGYFLSELASPNNYNLEWLRSPHFTIGLLIFIFGMGINLKSDAILIGLRKKGEKNYQIPKGFLFDYISSPNLFGEIIEWNGFAIMAWNLPALSFAIWTFANLVPRALNHHNWYKDKFPDYPKNRKAVFPYLF